MASFTGSIDWIEMGIRWINWYTTDAPSNVKVPFAHRMLLYGFCLHQFSICMEGIGNSVIFTESIGTLRIGPLTFSEPYSKYIWYKCIQIPGYQNRIPCPNLNVERQKHSPDLVRHLQCSWQCCSQKWYHGDPKTNLSAKWAHRWPISFGLPLLDSQPIRLAISIYSHFAFRVVNQQIRMNINAMAAMNKSVVFIRDFYIAILQRTASSRINQFIQLEFTKDLWPQKEISRWIHKSNKQINYGITYM